MRRCHPCVCRLSGALEEALDLFKLPRVIGSHEGKDVTSAIGRFGPYVRYENTFASIPKDTGENVFNITLERAIELIDERKQAESKKVIKTFDENPDIQVLNGRYGPYLKMGKKNFRIPKTQDPEKLTLEEAQAIIDKKK